MHLPLRIRQSARLGSSVLATSCTSLACPHLLVAQRLVAAALPALTERTCEQLPPAAAATTRILTGLSSALAATSTPWPACRGRRPPQVHGRLRDEADDLVGAGQVDLRQVRGTPG